MAAERDWNGAGPIGANRFRHYGNFISAASTATVKDHEYPDGSLAVFHGPRCLGRYDEKATLKEKRTEKRAA